MRELLNDLSDEKTFFKVLKDLDIDSGDEASEFIDDDLSDDDQDIAFETKAMKPTNFLRSNITPQEAYLLKQ